MATAVLAARVVLAGIFVAAGVGKLLDLPGSRRALVGFGLSESMAGPAGTLLPVIEIATALALLVRPSATGGAAVALLLLALFIAGIANALSRGEAPDCHCFGRIHSAPASGKEIARNVVLGAVSLFVLVKGPGPTLNGWLSARGAAEAAAVILGIATLTLIALSLDLWRQRQHLRDSMRGLRQVVDAAPPGLPVGSLAPSFSARDLNGDVFTLEDLRAKRRPIVLIFGAPGCGPCAALAPELPRWQKTFGRDLTIAPVGIGAYARYERASSSTGASLQQLYENDADLARELDDLNPVLGAYRLKATPAAVIVTAEGTIASATVDGRPAIKALIRLAAARRGAVGFAAGQAVAA